MMEGRVVEAREVVVPLVSVDSSGQPWEIDATIDTGFNGWLTLPAEAIRQIGCEWVRDDVALLAGHHPVVCEYYRDALFWHGKLRNVEVVQLEHEPLVGMGLLEDCRLLIEVADGGRVVIEPLRLRE